MIRTATHCLHRPHRAVDVGHPLLPGPVPAAPPQPLDRAQLLKLLVGLEGGPLRIPVDGHVPAGLRLWTRTDSGYVGRLCVQHDSAEVNFDPAVRGPLSDDETGFADG